MRERIFRPSRPARIQVDLIGDARIVITAPFYLDIDPLAPSEPWTLPNGEDLDGRGLLLRRELPLERLLLQGTLTYQRPQVDLLATFVGSDTWCDELRTRLKQFMADRTGQSGLESVEVVGLMFPDGYGSIGVTLEFPEGWNPSHRQATLDSVGQQGREPLAAELREALLPVVKRLVRRCGAQDHAQLPYFNLTYTGATDHPRPGRSSLSDNLRNLVYPNSAMPLPSHSPWSDEFLFAGYAYLVLATAHQRPSAKKLTLLLLILNVAFARVARTAAAAEEALRRHDHSADSVSLAALEYRLRAEYQSLINPTFSYDHHALRMRDAVLQSWEAGNLQNRTESLLAAVRQSVDLSLANEQAQRLRRVNLVIVILTVLSLVGTFEAGVEIYDRFFR